MERLNPHRVCGWVILAGLGGILSLEAGAQERPSEPVFRSETHLVDLTFSVRRSDGTLVSGLSRDDFQVSENGVAQRIAFFGKEDELPLSLGLIVDASDSQSKFIKRHRKDIEKFLHTVIHSKDEVFTICFGNHLRITNDSTSSIDQVMDGLERFDHGDRHFPEIADDRRDDQSGGGTALYDAVYYSTIQILASKEGRRRVLVLFSDGEENASAHDLLEAIDAAQENDTLIYAIRYTDEKEKQTPHARQGIAAMHHLSAETGGSDFDAMHTEVQRAFEQIAEELRSLYSLAYHSTNTIRDGTFRRVVITAPDPTYRLRARTGYYAR